MFGCWGRHSGVLSVLPSSELSATPECLYNRQVLSLHLFVGLFICCRCLWGSEDVSRVPTMSMLRQYLRLLGFCKYLYHWTISTDPVHLLSVMAEVDIVWSTFCFRLVFVSGFLILLPFLLFEVKPTLQCFPFIRPLGNVTVGTRAGFPLLPRIGSDSLTFSKSLPMPSASRDLLLSFLRRQKGTG